MSLRVVACAVAEDVQGDWPVSLLRVRFRWHEPPARFAIWLRVANLPESDFGLRVQVSRGRKLVFSSVEELILPGTDFVERVFVLARRNLRPKTYRVDVLLNGLVAHKLILDLGAPEVS
jgi:hypothetical protein